MADTIDWDKFLTWARSRPPEERYDYEDPLRCVIARWLRDELVEFHSVGPYSVSIRRHDEPIPVDIGVAVSSARTLGEVVEYLEHPERAPADMRESFLRDSPHYSHRVQYNARSYPL